MTTFRRDVETDGRRARVVFADRLEEDLDRRDFTINAVAWNPVTGEVRDPHGGVADLRAGVLRAVGDAEPASSRTVSACSGRCASPAASTSRSRRRPGRRRGSGELGGLSAERVREELTKVLGGLRSHPSH